MFPLVFIIAFEELEKALSTAQKTEESRRKMKVEMDEQIKAIEKTREEERTSLQRELSQMKQEVVDVTNVRIILDYNRLQQYGNISCMLFLQFLIVKKS